MERPSKALQSACSALITLLYGTIECLDKRKESIKALNWKKICSLFASPMNIINSIMNFKGLVQANLISKGFFRSKVLFSNVKIQGISKKLKDFCLKKRKAWNSQGLLIISGLLSQLLKTLLGIILMKPNLMNISRFLLPPKYFF